MRCLTQKMVWAATVCLLMIGTTVTAGTYDNKVENTDTMKEQMHDQEHAEKTKECQIVGRAGYLQRADKILGTTVHNPQGVALGTVRDVILNGTDQSVRYVIVAADTTLYPVPWTALDSSLESYTLDIDTDRLEGAPRIAALDIELLAGPELSEKTHEYYSEQISAVQKKGMGERAVGFVKGLFSDEAERPNLYFCSRILGSEIQDMQDERIGRLSDVVFDVREGNLAYGLVSFGGFLRIGTKTAAVPWEAIELQPDSRIARLDATEMALQAAVLPKGDLQSLSEPTFARQVHDEFGQEPYWEVYGFVEPAGTQETLFLAWRPDSDYNKSFNPNTVETIDVTVRQIGSFTPAEGAEPGLMLEVQTADDKTLTVHAGPELYHKQQDITFAEGDRLTITGSRAVVDEKDVFIATEIKRGDQTLRLRDADGKPLWELDKLQEKMQRDMERPTKRETDEPLRIPEDRPPRYY